MYFLYEYVLAQLHNTLSELMISFSSEYKNTETNQVSLISGQRGFITFVQNTSHVLYNALKNVVSVQVFF